MAKAQTVVLSRDTEGPARLRDGHVQEFRGETRGRYRQTASAPLRGYADAGQISEPQLRAGEWYEERFSIMYHCGRDETYDGTGSASVRMPLTADQADAMRQIVSVDSRLSFENRLIIRGICGEGKHATECIQQVTGEMSKHYPIPRFREALTKLEDAINDAEANRWKISLKPVN